MLKTFYLFFYLKSTIFNENNKAMERQNAKTPLKYFIFFYLMSVTLYSCDKKSEIDHPIKGGNEKIGIRSISNQEIDWLIDFQSYLYDLQRHVTRTNIYNLERAIYGVEALLNIRYAESKIGILKYTTADTFNIQSTTNWFDLFENARDNLLDDISSVSDTNIIISAFDIRVDTTIGSNIRIITSTIFKNKAANYVSKYSGTISPECTAQAFGEDEAYLLWLGGTDVWALWPANGLDCNGDCGSTSPGETAAMEEIQNHINASYPEPDCGPGLKFTNKYIDVHVDYAFIEWYQGRFEDCGIDPETEFFACDCLNQEMLDCILCTIYGEIDTYAFPISIPNGYYFMSIDLGVDFNYILPLEDTRTRIDIKYVYGKEVCAPEKPHYTQDVLTIDLGYLKCCP
ncbi:MAG: hypothetical protein IPP15_11795 [Saprospiraceae bacterium]|uniref:Uncharacterized protein n=1 Tax=Candidatus Opimibacter skivensis TaxID=2982028 RepID=A0A9D7SVV3_9BACT|nr:hypothetical protein [Candidatus Opimibacter skivensis]